MQMGITSHDFGCMTLIDFQRLMVYHTRKKCEQWEHTREIIGIIYNTNSKTKRDSIKLMPLPTDKAKRTNEITVEQRDHLLEKIKQHERIIRSRTKG